jgi:hypothetical protein
VLYVSSVSQTHHVIPVIGNRSFEVTTEKLETWCNGQSQAIRGSIDLDSSRAMTANADLLLRTSIEDTVAKCAKADGRVVMRLGAIVQVDSQQAYMVPDRCRDRGDKE